MKNRIFSVLLCCVLLVGLLPTVAFAEGETAGSEELNEISEDTFDVSNEEELIAAAAKISEEETGTHYIINLTQDFEVELPTHGTAIQHISFEHNTTTIYGNGHTLSWYANVNCLFYIRNATLNLGSNDDSKASELTITSRPYINGSSVDPTDEFIIMAENSTLNMYDGVTLKGNITGDGGLGMAVRVGDSNRLDYSGTVFNMYGGVIEDCEDYNYSGNGFYGAVVVLKNAVFNMYDGTIRNNKGARLGGAVCLEQSNATFNMYGGELTGNSVARNGGAVYAFSNAIFNMFGGSLMNNTAGNFGGAVFLAGNAIFNLYNGFLTGNSSIYGGAVSINPNANFQMSGGIIENNSAEAGGGVVNFGVITMTAGIIRNNQANVFADDIYTQNGSCTLTDAGDFGALTDTGLEIDGWYFDGSGDIDENGDEIETRWNGRGNEETIYIKEYTGYGAIDTTESVALKAAHDRHFTVTYKLNGGKWTDKRTTFTTKDDGKTYTMGAFANGTATKPTDPEPAYPTMEGQAFQVWCTADGKEYDFTTPVTADITLTAHWCEAKPVTHTVTFDANDGTIDGQEAVTEEVDDGKTVTPPTPTRDGYTFVGWYAEGEDEPFNFSQPITKNLTLYAQWTITTHTVTFDANGGEFPDGSAKKERTVPENATVTLPEPPTRPGYTFTGWNTQSDEGGTPFTGEAAVTGDMTVYAQWSKDSSGGGGGGGTTYCTLTYESNGGTVYPKESYPYGTTVQLTKVPTREGCRFTGWYADTGLTEKISSIKMTGSKAVYAGWAVSTVPERLNGEDHFAYIIGYSDGTVRPADNISRAEVATIFFRLLKDEVRDENLTTANTFSDVTEGMWCNTAISTMAELGIVKGRTASLFDPGANITRAEFAAICARFDTGLTEGDSDFTDISGHWAEAEIERAVSLGWIRGYGDGTFRPDAPITRAEAMTMINRVLCRIPENESDLLDGMRIWPDNQPDAWYYLAVQEATNSHNFVHKGEIYETWTELTIDPDWTRYQ